MTQTDSGGDVLDGSATTDAAVRPILCARRTTTDDGTTELTIFETDPPAGERTTRWITADAAAVVDLAAHR